MSTLGSTMTPNSNLASAPQQFCLKWGNHSSNLINTFNDLVLNESLTDVTLGCDGVMLKAHKIVLSANSNYFRDLFIATPCKHPIVILKDIKIEDLKAIIDFMYKGEVNISSAQMGNLLKTAETLRVKGLTVASDEKNESEIPPQQAPTSNNNSNDVPGLVYGETPNGTLGGNSSVNSPSDGQCFNSSSTGQPASPASLKKRKKKRNSGGGIPNSIANNANNTSSTVTSNNNGLRANNRVISSVSNVGQISMPLESVTSPHIHTPSTSLVVRNEVDDDLVPASNSDGEMDANSMDFDDDLNRVKRSAGRHERDPLVSAAVAQLSNSILPSTSSNMTLVSAANASPIVPMAAESSMSNRGQLRRPTVQQQSTQQLSQPQQQQQPSQPTAHTSSIQRDLVSAESSMAGDTVSNDGSESWSQQGNHNMNLSMRPSDMDDSESDHTSEIKPYISFSEGSESSCRGAVDMNAMNNALALVSNDQMSIPSQSPSQETQSAGKICVCQLCHLTFTAYSSLRRHMARHYTDRERYACDVCHKSYSRKDYLKEHKKLKHQINNN